jgi:hypothetical protein
MESKEYRMHSILFDGAKPGGTKKAMHAQRTKPSLQILKKTISAGKCCVRTVIFQRLVRENDSSRNNGGGKK